MTISTKEQRDAERYRWLRDATDPSFEVMYEDENEDGPTGVHYMLIGAELDTAIDAAMAGKRK